MAAESPSPYAFWDEVAALAARAARLAGDPSAPWPVRGRAAALCYTLSHDVVTDETLCAELVRGAFACIETFPLVLDLIAAARETAPDGSRLVTPLVRLCRHAHDAGHHPTVVVTLLQLLQIPSFKGEVPTAWLVSARGLEHEAGYWLLHLVRRWVVRFGAFSDGVRAIVQERQDDLFLQKRMPLHEIVRLHVAEPTVAGWVALARRRTELPPGPLPLSFGDRADDAIAALREAQLREHEAGEGVTLERWLREASD